MGGWQQRGQSNSPWPCLKLAPPWAAWSRLDRCGQKPRLRAGKALAQGSTAGPGFRSGMLVSPCRVQTPALPPPPTPIPNLPPQDTC